MSNELEAEQARPHAECLAEFRRRVLFDGGNEGDHAALRTIDDAEERIALSRREGAEKMREACVKAIAVLAYKLEGSPLPTVGSGIAQRIAEANRESLLGHVSIIEEMVRALPLPGDLEPSDAQ